MNTNHTFYAYLNIDNPFVKWEVAIGRIRSACDHANSPWALSVWQFSYLKNLAANGMTTKFRNELALENVRALHYPDEVSRLKGIFLFESNDEMHNAFVRWNVANSLRKNTSTIRFSANKVSRLDSEWITHNLLRDTLEDEWMHSYWSGQTYGTNPLTEVIASGIGIIGNICLRQHCYREIYNEVPLSSAILSMGAIGYHGGLESAMQAVAIIGNEKNGIYGHGYIDKSEIEELPTSDWHSIIERCNAEGTNFPVHPKAQNSKVFEIPALVQRFELSDHVASQLMS